MRPITKLQSNICGPIFFKFLIDSPPAGGSGKATATRQRPPQRARARAGAGAGEEGAWRVPGGLASSGGGARPRRGRGVIAGGSGAAPARPCGCRDAARVVCFGGASRGRAARCPRGGGAWRGALDGAVVYCGSPRAISRRHCVSVSPAPRTRVSATRPTAGSVKEHSSANSGMRCHAMLYVNLTILMHCVFHGYKKFMPD